LRKILYILIIFNFALSKNFIYNEDTWYSITSPEEITSISYNRNQVLFASENGLFVYDKISQDFYYSDYLLNNVEDKDIFIIHYDLYRDNYWMMNREELMFKSKLSTVWLKIRFDSLDLFSYKNVYNIGSSSDYIVIQTSNNRFLFLNPFTGRVENDILNEDVDFQLASVNWSSSYNSDFNNNINLMNYYMFDDWQITRYNEFEKNGKVVEVTCFLDEPNEYKWFGTDSGKIFFTAPYSNEIEEFKSIPPISNINIAYLDDNGGWWIADKDWIYNYSDILYNQEMVFLSYWDEKNNMWTKYYQNKYPQVMVKDINDLYRMNNTLYIATNSGLLIYDIALDKWNLLNVGDGLINDIILDIEYHEDVLYLATQGGLMTVSTLINKPVSSYFTKLIDKSIIDIDILGDDLYLLTDIGLLKMNTDTEEYDIVSKRKFKDIEIVDDRIFLSKNNAIYLWADNKLNFLFQYDKIKNFDVCNNYIWAHNKNSAMIYDMNTGNKLKYDKTDGIISDKINDIECDESWVWFSTDNGLSFYNWDKYHYEK
tara:strand:+ start:2488 stop:4107 length:1620 start_codon:yes stop_codon:yes gene_type:complete